MKIVYPNFNYTIDFENQNCFILTIENSKLFYDFCKDIFIQYNGETGDTIIFDDEKFTMEKNSILFYDYFNIENNTTKIINLINKTITSELNNGDYIKEISEINSLIVKLNQKLIEEIDLPIIYSDDFSIEKFVKLSNYSVAKNNKILEDILTSIEILINIKKVKLIIFINIFSILSEDEIYDLIKDLKYKDIKILFVNSYEKYKILDVEKIIIDDDLCVI